MKRVFVITKRSTWDQYHANPCVPVNFDEKVSFMVSPDHLSLVGEAA